MRLPSARWMGYSMAVFCLLLSRDHSGRAQAIKIPARVSVARPQLVCVVCTLTVSVSPANVNFLLVRNGTAAGNASLTLVTTLTGAATIYGTINLYAFFASSTADLKGNISSDDVLPSSAVLGRCTTGLPTTYTYYNKNDPLSLKKNSLEIFSQSANGLLLPATRTDTLALEISLAGLPTVAADTYSGVLLIQAEQF